MTSKPQLQWNKPTAEIELYEPLFKYAYLQKMHLIFPPRNVLDLWDEFTIKLFSTQDAFSKFEVITTESLRLQFNSRIQFFKTETGYEL